MEASSHGLIWGAVLAFAWRDEENHKNLSQDCQITGKDLNLGPPVYEAGVTSGF
jgi:hypothetical protein